MKRLGLVCTLLLGCAGCAAVPPAVVWTTAGAGLGFGAAALKFDDDIFNYFVSQKKAEEEQPSPPKP